MGKTLLFFSALTLGSSALLAQSTGGRQTLPAKPAVVNVLTVIGDNILGVPCLDCLIGILLPTLGLPSPSDDILRGGSYQVDAFFVDNSYTGPCTFEFTLKDRHKNIVASSTQTLSETANTRILVSSTLTIPPNAEIGVGSVSTKAVCGSTTTTSKSPTYISCASNPPHCSE